MEKTLEIEVRDVYGEAKCYPANDAARLFAEIAGTKTLTAATLDRAERLGYAIVDVTPRRSWKAA